MTEYKSSIKQINSSSEKVYNVLSNLKNLENILNFIPSEQKNKLDIKIVSSEECDLNIQGAGSIKFKIIEKEPNKLVKFEAIASPIPITIWIQLLEPNLNDTRIRVTLRTKMNFMIKKLIGNKLEVGIERMAELLSRILY